MKFKNIFNLIPLVVIFFITGIGTASAQENNYIPEENSAPCGMEYSVEAGSQIFPYVMKDRDFTICNEDIAYRMLYMIFGASMDSTLTKNLFHLFHDPHEATLTISEISPVGRVIKNIYESLTYLFFTAFIAVVGFQTLKYIYAAQVTGDFMGNRDGNKKAASVAINSLVIIALATPVGSLILVQAIIIALAVPAIMGANFFLSSFLGNVQVETTRVNISDEMLKNNSDVFSTEFVAGQMCEYQSQQAILNQNYFKSVYANRSFWRFWQSDDPLERAQSCNTYTDVLQTSDGFLSSITSEIRYRACNHHHRIPNIGRGNGENYGANHACFTMNYTQPSSSKLNTIFSTPRAVTIKNEILGGVKGGAVGDGIFSRIGNTVRGNRHDSNVYYNAFNFRDIKDNVITSSARSRIAVLQNSFNSGELEEEDFTLSLMEILNEESERFKNNYLISHQPIFEDNELTGYSMTDNSGGLLTLSDNDIASIGNNSEVFNLIYLKHLMATNKALGGYVNVPEHLEEYKVSRLARGAGLNFGIGKYGRDIKKLHLGVDVTGTEQIRADMNVREAAKNLIRLNCANELEDHREGFKFYKDWLSDNSTQMSSPNSNILSCIIFESRSEEDVVFHHLMDDFPTFNDALNIRNEDDVQDFMYENSELLYEYKLRSLNNLAEDMLMLSSYNYIVKKAFAESLATELKRNADYKVLADTRSKGWGGLGSMMLSIAAEQASSSVLVNDILSTGNPSGYSRGGSENRFTFVHEDIFSYLSEPDDRLEFADKNIKGVLLAGGLVSGNIASGVTSNNNLDLEMNFLQRFMTLIIEFVFHEPLTYLKLGAGMDVDKSLPQNLNSCSITGDCYPVDSHPLNATIMFGQTLLINTLSSILILSILNGIAKFILAADLSGKKDTSANSTGGLMKVLNGIVGILTFKLKGLTLILKAIAYIITVIAPLLISMLTMMFIPAMLLGFMLPTIPYLMSVMVILGWYLTLFIITLSFPIMLLMLSKIKEDGQTQLTIDFFWQKIGAVVIKPSLITISIIFSWILVNVSIFYINTTMFSIFSITALSGGGFLSDALGLFISYFIYSMVIYFVLQHSFHIILKFSDQTLSMLGLMSSGDEGLYSTLSVEKMLASQVMANKMSESSQHIQRGANSAGDKLASKNNEKKNNNSGETLRSKINQKSEK